MAGFGSDPVIPPKLFRRMANHGWPFDRTGRAMPPTDPPPPRFEDALAELEAVLRELEDGATSLEDALARYERGVGLLRHCHARLRDAEQRVRVLSGLTDDGAADLHPFDHVASIEAAKAAVRRPARPARDPGIPE